MHYQTTRKLARGGHILIAVVQLVYIYTPLHNLPYALLVVQCVTTPLLFISGMWITKGQKIWQWKNMLKKKRKNKRIAKRRLHARNHYKGK